MSSTPAALRSWEDALLPRILDDHHVTGRYGFELTYRDQLVFSSGLVYSSAEDAEQAADDASHVAWLWRAR